MSIHQRPGPGEAPLKQRCVRFMDVVGHKNDSLTALAGVQSAIKRHLGDELIAQFWRNHFTQHLLWWVYPEDPKIEFAKLGRALPIHTGWNCIRQVTDNLLSVVGICIRASHLHLATCLSYSGNRLQPLMFSKPRVQLWKIWSNTWMFSIPQFRLNLLPATSAAQWHCAAHFSRPVLKPRIHCKSFLRGMRQVGIAYNADESRWRHSCLLSQCRKWRTEWSLLLPYIWWVVLVLGTNKQDQHVPASFCVWVAAISEVLWGFCNFSVSWVAE